MHTFHIPKGNGKFRTIYIPNEEEDAILKKEKALIDQDIHAQLHAGLKHAHGNMPERSPVTNATAHIGPFDASISFDFEDFFATVRKENFPHIQKYNDTCFPDGAARQGLRTSPAIANLAAIPFDLEIETLLKSLSPRIQFNAAPSFIYTRYVDDLTFSCRDYRIVAFLKTRIPKIAQKHGFQINPRKTHVQSSDRGRRIICGIAVDDKKIHLTRHHRRRLRAATHAPIGFFHAQGLKEFCKLKPPKQKQTTTQTKHTKHISHPSHPISSILFGWIPRTILA